MSYSVFFPTGFNFVKGGKLPGASVAGVVQLLTLTGMYGGTKGCSGGSLAETCWSSRLMFRTGGLGEVSAL